MVASPIGLSLVREPGPSEHAGRGRLEPVYRCETAPCRDLAVSVRPRVELGEPITLLTTKWAIDALQTTRAPPTSPLVTNTQLL